LIQEEINISKKIMRKNIKQKISPEKSVKTGIKIYNNLKNG
jgi:hypothetical protein